MFKRYSEIRQSTAVAYDASYEVGLHLLETVISPNARLLLASVFGPCG